MAAHRKNTPADAISGHLAYRVENIYGETCQAIMDAAHIIHRPPRDDMAFVKTPDDISIELLQDGYLRAAGTQHGEQRAGKLPPSDRPYQSI